MAEIKGFWAFFWAFYLGFFLGFLFAPDFFLTHRCAAPSSSALGLRPHTPLRCLPLPWVFVLTLSHTAALRPSLRYFLPLRGCALLPLPRSTPARHGYGRWQAIVDDKDLRIQEVICQEMNLPFISTPALGAPQVQNVSSGTSQPQVHPLGTSQAQSSASGVSQPHVPAPGSSQPQNGVNSEHAEAPGIEAKGTTPGSESAADAAHGATHTASRSQLSQDQSTMYHFKEMQRRLVEFVKKRVLLLEKGLNAELQKEYYAEDKTNGVPNDDTGRKVTDIATPCSEALDTKKIDQLPQVEIISPSEITTVACDKKQDCLDKANLFNEMSRIVINTAPNSAETCYGPASLELRKNLAPLQYIGDEMNKILSLEQTSSPCDKLAPKVDHNSDDTTLGAGAMDIDTAADKTNQEANPGSESNNVSGAESAGDGCADVEVEEKQEDKIIIEEEYV